MSELIERQQAIDAVMEYGAIWMEYTDAMDKGEIAQRALNNAKSTMIRILKELPTIQPEPTDEQVAEYCKRRCLHVVTDDFFYTIQPEQHEGHWIEGGIYRDVIECYCSECGQLMTTAASVRMSFCPHCGAKMTISK